MYKLASALVLAALLQSSLGQVTTDAPASITISTSLGPGTYQFGNVNCAQTVYSYASLYCSSGVKVQFGDVVPATCNPQPSNTNVYGGTYTVEGNCCALFGNQFLGGTATLTCEPTSVTTADATTADTTTADATTAAGS